MRTNYTYEELANMKTIAKGMFGDELKILKDTYQVWLIHPDNRAESRDYLIDTLVDGMWIFKSYNFD